MIATPFYRRAEFWWPWALVVGLLLGGCTLHEIKFVPQCAGTPAASYPCIAPCKVKVYAPLPTEELIPNSFVMKDHTGVIRCSKEVS